MRIFRPASHLPVLCLCNKIFLIRLCGVHKQGAAVRASCEYSASWEHQGEEGEEERNQMLNSTAAAALAGMGSGAKTKRKTKCPSKACFCAILTVWQFVCIISIIVCGVLFLKPFLRVVRYRTTRCRVESFFITNQYVCECGDGCRSLYPCVLVHVSFNDSYGETNTVALFSDDIHQANVYEEKYNGLQKCSLRVCSNSEHINRQSVDNFLKQYGQKGSTFPCYYDWYSYQWGAIIEHKLPRMRVLHAMVWPILALLLGTLTCVVFCKRCRRITVEKSEKRTDSKKDKPKAAEEIINLTENAVQTLTEKKDDSNMEEVKLKPRQASIKNKSKTKTPRRDKTKVAETPNSTEKRNVWL